MSQKLASVNTVECKTTPEYQQLLFGGRVLLTLNVEKARTNSDVEDQFHKKV